MSGEGDPSDEPRRTSPDDETSGDKRDAGQRRPDSDRLDSSFRRLFTDGLSGLLESGGAIRRGHEAVSELAAGTKEEVVRRVSTELRGFLDQLDVTDLARQVLEGMTVDVTAQVRFRRTPTGGLESEIADDPTISIRKRGDAKPAPEDPESDE